jgi:hypothetical protein
MHQNRREPNRQDTKNYGGQEERQKRFDMNFTN